MLISPCSRPLFQRLQLYAACPLTSFKPLNDEGNLWKQRVRFCRSRKQCRKRPTADRVADCWTRRASLDQPLSDWPPIATQALRCSTIGYGWSFPLDYSNLS